MPEQSNGDPQDKMYRKEKDVRFKGIEGMGTRAMLLRAMELLGDERIGDDQLRRVLSILEGVEPDEDT